MQQKITPNLWFDTEAEAAAGFYTSVFKDSRIVNVTHYTEAGRATRAMEAMLGMGKIDIAALRSAADGVSAT